MTAERASARTPYKAVRHRIGPVEVHFALEKRGHRASWSSIAAMLDVSEPDLRQACEQQARPPREPLPPKIDGAAVQPGTLQALTLKEIARGCRFLDEVASALERSSRRTGPVLLELRQKGLVHSNGGLHGLTPHGAETLALLGRAETSRPKATP